MQFFVISILHMLLSWWQFFDILCSPSWRLVHFEVKRASRKTSWLLVVFLCYAGLCTINDRWNCESVPNFLLLTESRRVSSGASVLRLVSRDNSDALQICWVSGAVCWCLLSALPLSWSQFDKALTCISYQDTDYKRSISTEECLAICLRLVGITQETVPLENVPLHHLAESLIGWRFVLTYRILDFPAQVSAALDTH